MRHLSSEERAQLRAMADNCGFHELLGQIGSMVRYDGLTKDPGGSEELDALLRLIFDARRAVAHVLQENKS
jgi:hypothetical protein